MRFSSVFQSASPQPAQPGEPPAADMRQPVAATTPDLPDDLDARVRLVGEWQLDVGWA